MFPKHEFKALSSIFREFEFSMVLPGERIKEFFTLKLMKNIVTLLCILCFQPIIFGRLLTDYLALFFFEPHHALIQLIQPITYKAQGQ